jgi:8-oxo-dGTP pyrophosphatase MutT (NUDIX family)
MDADPYSIYRQSGAVPFRVRDGGLEVLLITSLSSARWIIPKGIIEPDLSPAASAAREAQEEAGVRGELSGPVGRFTVRKWGGACTVEVFLLRVTELDEQWPEADVRQRRWVAARDAPRLVRNRGLRAILDRLPQLVAERFRKSSEGPSPSPSS